MLRNKAAYTYKNWYKWSYEIIKCWKNGTVVLQMGATLDRPDIWTVDPYKSEYTPCKFQEAPKLHTVYTFRDHTQPWIEKYIHTYIMRQRVFMLRSFLLTNEVLNEICIILFPQK